MLNAHLRFRVVRALGVSGFKAVGCQIQGTQKLSASVGTLRSVLLRKSMWSCTSQQTTDWTKEQVLCVLLKPFRW